MAAFLLFVLAVAGGVTAADLVRENTDAGQITVFHHTVSGYPVGRLLVVAAGLGFVVAVLLVASMNSTKGRHARCKQLVRLRRGLEHQAVAPTPDHARLLDAFFGPKQPSGHLGGPARPVDSGAKAESAEPKTTSAGSPPTDPAPHRAALPAGQIGPCQGRRPGGPSGRRSALGHRRTGPVSRRAALRAGQAGGWPVR